MVWGRNDGGRRNMHFYVQHAEICYKWASEGWGGMTQVIKRYKQMHYTIHIYGRNTNISTQTMYAHSPPRT